MRTCDICSTPIPFGDNRCPKCGYRYRPEKRLNEGVRQAKKAEYMSQFKQHPSPLDEVKKALNNSGNIDFSAVLDRFNKSKGKSRSSYSQQSSTVQFVKRMVTTLIIISLIIFMIPVGLGIYFGISNEFDVIEDFVVEEDYATEWYESFASLKEIYPKVADDVMPYRQYVIDKALEYNNNFFDNLTESYYINNEILEDAYIDTPIEYESNVLTMQVSYNAYEWDAWYETYYGYTYFDENEVSYVDENVIKAISELSEHSYDLLYKHTSDFVSEIIGEPTSVEYQLGTGTFSIYYDGQYIDYTFTRRVVLP